MFLDCIYNLESIFYGFLLKYFIFAKVLHLQKQGCVSASTPEAEVVALLQMVKNLGIPSLDFLDIVFGRKTHIKVYEDNEATQKILKNGKFEKALGHVNRTHGITLSWLTDVLAQKQIVIADCHTKAMCADIFTKYLPMPQHGSTLLRC